MAVSTYSCLNCGSDVRFDINSQSFKCVSCLTAYTLDEMNQAFPDEDGAIWETARKTKVDLKTSHISKAGDREAAVKLYHCPSCGAELMSESDTLAAAFCAFCGKPAAISDRLLSGDDLPSRCIPFVKKQDEAFEIFQRKLRNKPLLPRVFKDDIKPGDFKSVYVPFMLYDAACSVGVTATCENITTWSDSKYNYTKVDTYEARRYGSMDFAQVPADASDKMDDGDMRAVEPFEMSALLPFSTTYLSGHYAEAPTTSQPRLLETLYGRIKPAAESVLLGTITGYDRVSVKESSVSLENAAAEYVMLPVWMFVRRFKEKDYIFAVNGQTGRFAGKFPVDGSRALLLFVKLALIVFAAAFIGLEVFLWLA